MVNSKIGRHSARLLTHPFLFLVYGLSHFFPRKNTLWVFGIPKKFTWSSKYLFLYLVNNKEKGMRPIWITRSKPLLKELRSRGYPAYFWLSFGGIWSCMRAGFFIVDASLDTIHYWLSGGAKEVLLWHGIPLKKIERDVTKGESSDVKVRQAKGFLGFAMRFLLPFAFRRPDYAIATSSVFQEILAGAFGMKKERVFITGFPKNDVYFGAMPGAEIGADQEVLAKLQQLKKESSLPRTILYAPTWRDTGGDSFFEKPDALLRLDEFLTQENLFFFLKLHPLAQAKATVNAREGREYKNIIFVNPESDADPLLSFIDILVTDYSGIYFEFLLLDRPIIFFPFDYEKYVTRDRELYFPYEEITPGPKARTLQELMQTLKGVIRGKDEYASFRKKVRELTYTYQDGKSAERVFSVLKDLCEKKKSFS